MAMRFKSSDHNIALNDTEYPGQQRIESTIFFNLPYKKYEPKLLKI